MNREEAIKRCKEDLLVREMLKLEERDRHESVGEWLKKRRRHLVKK